MIALIMLRSLINEPQIALSVATYSPEMYMIVYFSWRAADPHWGTV